MNEPTTVTGEAMAAGGAPRVVVGVDGSPGARSALVWALAAAARSGAVLEVLATFPVEIYWADPYLLDTRRTEAIRSDTLARAREFVDEILADPAAAIPGASTVSIDVRVAAGPAADVLVARAEGAQLLVVGSRGRGGVRSTVLGSVALHCSAHAPCPVVVVHPTSRAPSRAVVVGLDDSPMSRAACARAVEEADRLGGDVTAVVAHQPPAYWSDLYAVTAPPVGETLEEAQRRAEALVADVLGNVPAVGVKVVAEAGAPGEVLVRQAEDAALLVVGSRSRNQLAGMLLGSVALHCVVHAACPVMVVHPEPAGSADAVTVPA